MNDIWKIWKYITPREGVMGLAGLMVASFLIHVMVITSVDRYAEALLGAGG